MRNGHGKARLLPTDSGFPLTLYARVSTTQQDPEMYLKDLRALASARGWTINRVYVDTGVSGASTSRPELSRLLTDAHRGCFAGTLVWRLDRLGRSLQHLVTVVEDLLAPGIEVISAPEPHMDSTTPTGRPLRNISASVAEYEREGFLFVKHGSALYPIRVRLFIILLNSSSLPGATRGLRARES